MPGAPPPKLTAEVAARGLSARERWMVRGVLAAVAAVALALVISFAIPSKTSRHGCIYATIPGPVGAQQIDECGAQARATCASVRSPGAFTAQAARSVAAECRKAGLPLGP